jgi:ribose transport system permease protein
MAAFVKRYGSLFGMLAIVVVFWIALPDTFMTARNLLNISQQVAMLTVVAVTMTLVMVTGDFDLSVGSMASLAAVVAAVLFIANGFLVAVLGILPFVATLATLTMFSGAAFVFSGGKTIFGRDIPQALSDFARAGLPLGTAGDKPLLLPALTLVALGMTALVWLLLEQTTYGRRLYAIGGNAEAARMAGVRVRLLRLSAFAVTGFGASLAGLMYMARVASANPVQGDGLMLSAIAAVFLGMTVTRDGQPHVLATVAGVLTLGVLDNGLTQLQVDSYVRQVLVGAIILAAVSSSAIGRKALRLR